MKFSPSGAVIGFLSVAEVGFAVTIIVLIAQELWPNAGYYTVCNTVTGVCGTAYWDGICLMSNNSINVCAYGYATAVLGIVASLFTVFAACLPAMVSVLVSLFGSLWWLAYAITATVYSHNVGNDTGLLLPNGYPRGNYRVMVYALSWTTFSCCAVSVLLAAKMRSEKPKEPEGKLPSYSGEPVKGGDAPPAAMV